MLVDIVVEYLRALLFNNTLVSRNIGQQPLMYLYVRLLLRKIRGITLLTVWED